MVVRNLARDVVKNVCLRGSVGEVSAEPTSDSTNNTWTSKQVTIKCCQSSARKRERGRAVVGKEGVRVLHM